MNELKIHDIKNLVEVPDISFYLFISLIILAFLILCISIYLLYKKFKNKNKKIRKEYYKILQEIDFSKSKNAAYKITKYARLLAISQREIKLANELILQLEKHKYKKDVEDINKSIKIKYEIFMDALDV